MTQSKHADEITQPIKEQSTESLPSAVTFFLQAQQRRALLKALCAYSNDRSQAILIALGITDNQVVSDSPYIPITRLPRASGGGGCAADGGGASKRC